MCARRVHKWFYLSNFISNPINVSFIENGIGGDGFEWSHA